MDAIRYVTFGAKFFDKREDGKDYGERLLQMLIDPQSKCYNYLKGCAFSKIEYDQGPHEVPADGWMQKYNCSLLKRS